MVVIPAKAGIHLLPISCWGDACVAPAKDPAGVQLRRDLVHSISSSADQRIATCLDGSLEWAITASVCARISLNSAVSELLSVAPL
jgi:hypothetical protein